MKAFITGGAGFLGYHLVKLLLAENWQVSVLDISSNHRDTLKSLGVNFYQASIAETQKVFELVEPDTDAFFHIAGNTSLWSKNNKQQTIDNIQGTQNMLEIARRQTVKRFIYTSSYTTFGFQPKQFTEQAVSNAMQSGINYFISKALAEKKVKEAAAMGQDTVILNPANIMGPFDYRNWSQLFILIDQAKLPGAPAGNGSFANVEDVAAAHLSAFHKGRRGENYLLGGVNISYLEHIQAIGKYLGRKTPNHVIPAWLLVPLANMQNALAYITGREPDVTPEKAKYFSGNLCCDDSKARLELDYHPSSLQDMIVSTAEWLRSEGLMSEEAH